MENSINELLKEIKVDTARNEAIRILNTIGFRTIECGYRFWVNIAEYIIKKKLESKKRYNYTLKEVCSYLSEKTSLRSKSIQTMLSNTLKVREKEIKNYFNVTYAINNRTFLALLIFEIEEKIESKFNK